MDRVILIKVCAGGVVAEIAPPFLGVIKGLRRCVYRCDIVAFYTIDLGDVWDCDRKNPTSSCLLSSMTPSFASSYIRVQIGQIHCFLISLLQNFKNLRCHSIQEMGLSHLIQRSITKKLLPSKPSNIISSSWFLADTTAKSFDLSGGSNGAKINSFDDNDIVFWEPNKPVTIEEFQMPRPKAGEGQYMSFFAVACGVCHSDLHVIKGEIPFPSPCAIGHEITGEVVEHGELSDRKTIERFPVGSRVVGAFIMPCGNCFYCSKGHDDLCEDFFAYNRSKGTLYDGETRLFLRNSACCNAPNTTFISVQYANSTIKSMSLDAVIGTPSLIAVYLSAMKW
uniref:Alcohol dehydrogenase-like N-terminal domain-containing protein n=1 Tax=Salix viminalis TaxID=40686 RepID=A0A6N2KPP4_SALVM